MAVDAKTVTKTKLVAQSIDFVEQFNGNITKLMEILGVARKTPMNVGANIKLYKSTVTLGGDTVAEGEVIPLSEVKKELASTKELTFAKYRKMVTGEAIQSSGFSAAVSDTDNELLKKVQAKVKADLIATFAKGKGTAKGSSFQLAVSKALGQLAVAFEDDDIQSVVLANPVDFYDYLGAAPITLQTGFGMNYIQNFLGVNTIILSNAVPAKTIYATASQNINVFFANVASGDLASAFELQADATGLIGIGHTPVNNSLSYESVVVSAVAAFPERLDGVIVGTIEEVVAP